MAYYMKKIEVVPRLRVEEIYYTIEQLPEEKVREIALAKIDLAMTGISFVKINDKRR